jgi:NifU-like protein involved in Fe-S cluster formation
MVTELAKGKDILSAFTITQDKLLKALGGLPKAEQHCAFLATSTLCKALADYLYTKREPWRKIYRLK